MCGGYRESGADIMKQKIKIFAMDVDGTLTDGKLYMGDHGEACKAFHIKDGMGIRLLEKHGILPVIITGRKSKIVENRAKELGITELYQGISDKAAVLKKLMETYQTEAAQAAYIGDDINDLSAMRCVGLSFAPADASEDVKKQAHIVLSAKGGYGAVREAVEYVLDMGKERE